MNNKDKKTITSLILSAVAIIISIAAIVLCLTQRGSGMSGISKTDTQYVLYLGVNDKITDQPVYSHDEARRVLEDILARRIGGYTVVEADGGWTGDDNVVYQGYTLVIYLSDTTTEKVHALCDELLERFDQSCILINTNKSGSEFYRGR